MDRYFELSLREGNREAFLQRDRAASRSAREDPSAALARIDAPTLVQWGGQDEWIPPARPMQPLRRARPSARTGPRE